MKQLEVFKTDFQISQENNQQNDRKLFHKWNHDQMEHENLEDN